MRAERALLPYSRSVGRSVGWVLVLMWVVLDLLRVLFTLLGGKISWF